MKSLFEIFHIYDIFFDYDFADYKPFGYRYLLSIIALLFHCAVMGAVMGLALLLVTDIFIPNGNMWFDIVGAIFLLCYTVFLGYKTIKYTIQLYYASSYNLNQIRGRRK